MSFLSKIFSNKNEEKKVTNSSEIQEKFKEQILLNINKNQEKLQLLLNSNIQRNSVSVSSNQYSSNNDFFHDQNIFVQQEKLGIADFGYGYYPKM